MEELPSNSQGARKPTSEPKKVEKVEKKVEKIVEGEVRTRKTPLGKRFMQTFVGGTAKSVWSYVLLDVLIPAAKDTIADAVSQGIEKMLFGEGRSTSRRTGYRPGSSNPYTSYNRYSSSPSPREHRREDPRLSRRARASHDFQEIILATRHEADEVIDRLFSLVSQYDHATVNDLYDMVGISGDFTDEKWGWTDLRGAGVTWIRNGYLLDLPRPEPLDR